MTAEEFFKKYFPAASETNKKYGIPTSIVLAAGSLESGNANSELATTYHNFFGIKTDQGYGLTPYLATTEYVDGKPQAKLSQFALFPDDATGFQAYGKFLSDNPRYEKAGVFTKGATYGQVADSLQAAKYATDPAYAQLLKDVVTDNNLQYYDIKLDPNSGNHTGVYTGDISVLESTFGNYATDTDRQQAYDRAAATDPAAGIPTLGDLGIPSISGIGQGVAKAVIIILLIVVIIIFVLQVFPLSPANMAAKVAKGVVAS